MVKQRETFHFNPPIQVEHDWMLELTSLEVYKSIFNITEHNNKFEFYKFPDEKSGISYEKVRNESERDLDISDFSPTDSEDEKLDLLLLKNIHNK